MASRRQTRPTRIGWVSKPGIDIYLKDLGSLQRQFGNQLDISRGKHGEVVIVAPPDQRSKLNRAMLLIGGVFTQQKFHSRPQPKQSRRPQ